MKKDEKGSLKTLDFICTLLVAIGFIGLFLSMTTPISKEYIPFLDDKMMLAKVFLGSCLLIIVFAPIGWKYDDKLKKLEQA